jgi:uncharacterized protein (TIGR00369 family)
MPLHEDTDYNALLGMELLGGQDDTYELALEIRACHLNGAGGVHGGVYLGLLDTVMARACRSGQPEPAYWPTLELKVNFLRSVASGRISARGRVVKRGRRVCFVEGELIGDEGRLLARGSATLLAATEAG